MLTRERDAARLGAARLRYAVENPAGACAWVIHHREYVWWNWRREHRVPDDVALRTEVIVRWYGVPVAVALAEMLARAGWTPTEGT